MNIKKINEIFGYGLLVIGLLKILLVFLTFIQVGANISAIFNGQDIDDSSMDIYYSFSIILGFTQIIIAIGSVIMIILNINKEKDAIIGYLWGLGAILLELIMPRFLSLYFVFVECGMYMKGGTKLKGKNTILNNTNIKQTVKNTEWFYGKDDK